jgi:AraC-like DNA-binding protein
LGAAFGNNVARNFGDASGTARLLPCYLASLFEELSGVAAGNCSELADMAAQLVRLALLEARQATTPISMRETLRLRVKDYVRRNLRDPALSIDRVALAFGCTKRHLHKVFTGDETTLSQFIWAQRLESCREALRNPHLLRHSITEIAFMWGFNNSAHFSKAFKERFGLPPGIFRGRGSAPADAGPLLHAAA